VSLLGHLEWKEINEQTKVSEIKYTVSPVFSIAGFMENRTFIL